MDLDNIDRQQLKFNQGSLNRYLRLQEPEMGFMFLFSFLKVCQFFKTLFNSDIEKEYHDLSEEMVNFLNLIEIEQIESLTSLSKENELGHQKDICHFLQKGKIMVFSQKISTHNLMKGQTHLKAVVQLKKSLTQKKEAVDEVDIHNRQRMISLVDELKRQDSQGEEYDET